MPSLLVPQFSSAGLQPLLDTSEFEEWSCAVGANLGHHRSDLATGACTFRSRMAGGEADGLRLLHIEGCGDVSLDRVQGDQATVLWLPLQGYSEERINGELVLAEPGMALLMRPGDVLRGRTSRHLEGLSILLPPDRIDATCPRLLDLGAHHRALIAAARRFAESLGTGLQQGRLGAHALLDQLEAWQWAVLARASGEREPITAVRRRVSVGEACAWMRAHLDGPFEVAQVAGAINVSVRTLQYAFLQETGQTPMAVAKRFRLRRLRALLLDPETASDSIADLMGRVGLLACGATAADYRMYCGETPRQTRQRR